MLEEIAKAGLFSVSAEFQEYIGQLHMMAIIWSRGQPSRKNNLTPRFRLEIAARVFMARSVCDP
jgi:hypothetical protein